MLSIPTVLPYRRFVPTLFLLAIQSACNVCPKGTSLIGNPPPNGHEQACMRPDGVKHGQTTSYYQNGQKKEAGHYAAGKKVGIWTRWNANGKKLYSINYNAKSRSQLKTRTKPSTTSPSDNDWLPNTFDLCGRRFDLAIAPPKSAESSKDDFLVTTNRVGLLIAGELPKPDVLRRYGWVIVEQDWQGKDASFMAWHTPNQISGSDALDKVKRAVQGYECEFNSARNLIRISEHTLTYDISDRRFTTTNGIKIGSKLPSKLMAKARYIIENDTYFVRIPGTKTNASTRGGRVINFSGTIPIK